MKKQQIPFDFSKWGQEGISVIFNNNKGLICDMFTLHESPEGNHFFYGLSIDFGCIQGYTPSFTMYQEIKPREIWVNIYPNGAMTCRLTKQEALEMKSPDCVSLSKFIEVID